MKIKVTKSATYLCAAIFWLLVISLCWGSCKAYRRAPAVTNPHVHTWGKWEGDRTVVGWGGRFVLQHRTCATCGYTQVEAHQ